MESDKELKEETTTEEDVKKLAEESEVKQTPDLDKEMQEAIEIPGD